MTRGNPDLPGPSDLMTLSEEPLCRESSLTSLHTQITPTERFYVRNHFPETPDLKVSDWGSTEKSTIP